MATATSSGRTRAWTTSGGPIPPPSTCCTASTGRPAQEAALRYGFRPVDPDLVRFMAAVESGVIHYGSSTGFFAERMFERGPSYLSAAVLYENLVVAQESKRLAGQSNQGPVVAIYPKEGTFWSDHPYVILNAPWVTAEQREAAESFQAFLLDRPQQLRAIELGFRPADVGIPLAAPLDTGHGVDPAQPQTVLEAPGSDVLTAVLDLWQQVKKPVDLIVLVDVSGSMQGDKIAAARSSLLEFVGQLDDRDRLEVLVFADDVLILTPLTELGSKRQDVQRRISGILEGGNTRLYDATLVALEALQKNGDPRHIRAVVVLSDGMDTRSTAVLDDVLTGVGQVSEEGGTSIKLFTIAFGADADKNVLRQMAEKTGGKLYSGDPKTIRQIYAKIESATDPVVRFQYEESRRAQEERSANLEEVNRQLERTEALYASLASALENTLTEVIRVQTLNPEQSQERVPDLVHDLEQRRAQLREFADRLGEL